MAHPVSDVAVLQARALDARIQGNSATDANVRRMRLAQADRLDRAARLAYCRRLAAEAAR
jgi:hypothetical protein